MYGYVYLAVNKALKNNKSSSKTAFHTINNNLTYLIETISQQATKYLLFLIPNAPWTTP